MFRAKGGPPNDNAVSSGPLLVEKRIPGAAGKPKRHFREEAPELVSRGQTQSPGRAAGEVKKS